MKAAPERGGEPQAGKTDERSVTGTKTDGGGQPPEYIEVDGVVYPLTVRCRNAVSAASVIEKMIKNVSETLANQPDLIYNGTALIGLIHREED